VLGQEVEGRLRRLVATPREPSRPDGDHRLPHIVARPLRISPGVEEDEEPVHLVRLDDLDPRRRKQPHDADDGHDGDHRQRGEVRPRRPVEVQHGEHESDVDRARAEVGLEEDEGGGDGDVHEGLDGDAPRTEQFHTVDEERAQRDGHEHEADLRRLKVEEGQLDPAPRTPGHRAERVHRSDREHRHRVDGPLPAPVDPVVDHRDGGESDEPDDRVDDLGARVVERVARDVAACREVDRRHTVDDEAEHRRQKDVVETTQAGTDVHAQSVLVAPVA